MDEKSDVKLINIHLKDSWIVSLNVEIETPTINEEKTLYYFIERGEQKALYKVFYNPDQGYSFNGCGYDLSGLAEVIGNSFENDYFPSQMAKNVEVHRYMYPRERAFAERVLKMIEVFLKICTLVGLLVFMILGAAMAMMIAALLTRWFSIEGEKDELER